MRYVVVAVIVFFSIFSVALAEEKNGISRYTEIICENGCVMMVKFPEKARYPAVSEYAGEYLEEIVNDPMKYIHAIVSTKSGQRLIVLQGHGNPKFTNEEDVKKFLETGNLFIRSLLKVKKNLPAS